MNSETSRPDGQVPDERLPPGTFFAHTIPEEELDSLVRTTLERTGQYQTIQLSHINKGRTRICYTAYYTPSRFNCPRPVMVKVDRPMDQISGRANLHVLRGCDTANDVGFLLNLKHPSNHYIIQPFTPIEVTGQNGENLVISTEELFSMSISLEEMVLEESGSLGKTGFTPIFFQVIEAIRYFNSDEAFLGGVGAFHRDLNPRNILIGPRNSVPRSGSFERSEVRITDFANACKRNEPRSKPMPTAGGHFITNPFLFECFTGDLASYDDKSEVYAIGANMYFALTGKYMFDCNPTIGTGTAILDGQEVNLLDNRGRIRIPLFRKVIKNNLGSMVGTDWHARVIEKCLLSPLGQGYETVEELQRDFNQYADRDPEFIHWLASHNGVVNGHATREQEIAQRTRSLTSHLFVANAVAVALLLTLNKGCSLQKEKPANPAFETSERSLYFPVRKYHSLMRDQ